MRSARIPVESLRAATAEWWRRWVAEPGSSLEPSALRSLFDRLERVPDRVVQVALFAFALWPRLVYRNAGLFLYDGVALAQAVEKTFATGVLHGQVNGRYGTVVANLILYAPYRWITGIHSAEQTVILTNVIFGSLGVVAVFAWMRRLFGSRAVAVFAAVTYSVSPIYLSVTTYGKPHGLEVFLIVSAFSMATALPEERSRRRSLARRATGSALLGAAILSREATLIFLPLYALVCLNPTLTSRRPFVALDRSLFRPTGLLAAFAPLVLALGFGWVSFLGDVVRRTLTQPGPETVTFRGLVSPILPTALGDLYFDLGGLGVLLAALGLVAGWRRSENKLPLLLLVSWAGLILYVGNTSSYRPRYLAIVSVACFGLVGLGLERIRRLSRLLAIALCVALSVGLFVKIRPIIAYRSRASGGKDYALWLKGRVPKDSTIIAMDDSIFIEYYAGLATRAHPIGDPMAMRTWMAQTRELVEKGTPVYIIQSGFSYDPGSLFRRELLQSFRLELAGVRTTENYHRSGIQLRRYRSHLFRLVLKGGSTPESGGASRGSPGRGPAPGPQRTSPPPGVSGGRLGRLKGAGSSRSSPTGLPRLRLPEPALEASPRVMI